MGYGQEENKKAIGQNDTRCMGLIGTRIFLFRNLLPLAWGCDGVAAGCAAHSVRQAGRGFASVLTSLIQHAGADAASDSTLGAIRRNGFGTGDPLLAQPSGKAPVGVNPGRPRTEGSMIAELVVFGRSGRLHQAAINNRLRSERDTLLHAVSNSKRQCQMKHRLN